jgi:hypothetical protein
MSNEQKLATERPRLNIEARKKLKELQRELLWLKDQEDADWVNKHYSARNANISQAKIIQHALDRLDDGELNPEVEE